MQNPNYNIIMQSSTIKYTADINIKDIPSSTGRADVIARCIKAALLTSVEPHNWGFYLFFNNDFYNAINSFKLLLALDTPNENSSTIREPISTIKFGLFVNKDSKFIQKVVLNRYNKYGIDEMISDKEIVEEMYKDFNIIAKNASQLNQSRLNLNFFTDFIPLSAEEFINENNSADKVFITLDENAEIKLIKDIIANALKIKEESEDSCNNLDNSSKPSKIPSFNIYSTLDIDIKVTKNLFFIIGDQLGTRPFINKDTILNIRNVRLGRKSLLASSIISILNMLFSLK